MLSTTNMIISYLKEVLELDIVYRVNTVGQLTFKDIKFLKIVKNLSYT